jgi:rubredoxin
MSRKDDEVHIQLGREHARSGLPRYKYVDKRLQELYDRGYNDPDQQFIANMKYSDVFNRHRCPRCGKSMTNTFWELCSMCRGRQ